VNAKERHAWAWESMNIVKIVRKVGNAWEHCNFEWNFVIKMFMKGTMRGVTKH
jgi:hypothetical protein